MTVELCVVDFVVLAVLDPERVAVDEADNEAVVLADVVCVLLSVPDADVDAELDRVDVSEDVPELVADVD